MTALYVRLYFSTSFVKVEAALLEISLLHVAAKGSSLFFGLGSLGRTSQATSKPNDIRSYYYYQ
jgi:hypothetical protein